MMRKKDIYYLSADEKTRIHAVEWRPDGEIRCIVQIVHGMAEYIDRYERTASVLAEQGILVVGEDHLGHGKSVSEEVPYGYFCKGDAVETLLKDVHTLRERIQEENPEIPYVIWGHSMGSFIVRNYICSYGEGLAGALIMGTGMTPKKLLNVSLKLVKFLSVFQGSKHPSKLINVMAFGQYNKRIRNSISVFDWLSTESVEVMRYEEDPLCGFMFTLNGFGTLFTLLDRLHDQERLKKMPKNLPILFMSGTEDPVGDYGRAVEEVYRSFRELGMTDVELHMYENDRHELVNESDREMVWKDIAAWVFGLTGTAAPSEYERV